MTEEGQGLFTITEAASIWGISRQAVHKRLTTLDNQGYTRLTGGKRYITREGIEAYSEVDNQPVNQSVNHSVNPSTDTVNLSTEVDNLKKELDQAKAALLAEQGRTSTLQATIDAQQAHIDSLKTALDREQALHMASLQQRLPAPGKGFFAWLKGRKGTE